jgi:hypothetical protein
MRPQPSGFNQGHDLAEGSDSPPNTRCRLRPSLSPLGRREARDLSIAHAIVHEGDDLARNCHLGDGSTVAPLGDAPEVPP